MVAGTKKTGKKRPEERDSKPSAVDRLLRDSAEEQLARSPKRSSCQKEQTPEQLVHELEVHQIELEMQAEELRISRLALEESRDKYLDLFEFAPLGYFTLNDKALISQANLSAAVLLRTDRSKLINARFRTLIVSEDYETWDRYFINLLTSGKKLTTTLMLMRGDKATFSARLEGIRLSGSSNEPSIRVAVSDITDLRQAEWARRESEHLLKTVIDLLPVGVLILDRKGEALTINPEAERIWGGMRSRGIVPSPEYKCWRLEDGARIEARNWAGARAIKDGKKTLEEQIELECHDGTHKIALNSALPIKRSDGSIAGAVVVTQDITDGKVAEERIQWLASFPELNPDPIIEVDSQGTVTYANPATRTILKDLDLPDDPTLFVSEDKKEIIRLLKKGSEPRLYREISLGREIFSEDITLDRELQVIRIYARNISSRKRTEEFIRLLANIADDAPASVLVHDFDGRILYANDQTFRLHGYTREEFLAKNLHEIDVPESEQLIAERMQRIHDRGMADFEVEHFRKDGSRFPLHVSAKYMEWGDRDVMLSIATDISDSKKTEEVLRLANRKLNLLSSITRHDINNQLTALQGYTALLEKKQPDPHLHAYFRKINTAAERISAMIRFTGEYEQIGVKTPAWQNCRALADIAVKEAPLGHVTVKNDLPAGGEVFADPLVARIGYILLDNAVRHGGKITTIRFSVQGSDDAPRIVCEDDGDGVPAADKEKIFERGYGKNSGMGLFLAREILAITGIIICETGEPGRGARFELVVPKGMWRVKGDGV